MIKMGGGGELATLTVKYDRESLSINILTFLHIYFVNGVLTIFLLATVVIFIFIFRKSVILETKIKVYSCFNDRLL